MVARLLSLVRKELIQVFRNRITLMLSLVTPVVQLLIFGYVAIIDVNHVPTAVLDQSRTAESRRLLSDFVSSGYFDIVRTLESDAEIDRLLLSGAVDLVVIIPEDFSTRLATGRKTEIIGIMDGSDSNTAITVGNYFNGVALRYSINAVGKLPGLAGTTFTAPVDSRPRVYFNPEMKSVYSLVPGIIAVLLMMVLCLLSAISVVRERERGTWEQLTVTPLRVGELLLGKTIPFALLGFVSTIMVSVVGMIWFSVPFRGDFLLLMALAGLFMITALGIGILVSSVARTQQQAMMMTMFVLIPQILLSGFIFPIESMPDVMQWFTLVIPTRYFLVIIRGIFLKGVGVAELVPEILALVVFSVVIFTVATIRFRRRAAM